MTRIPAPGALSAALLRRLDKLYWRRVDHAEGLRCTTIHAQEDRPFLQAPIPTEAVLAERFKVLNGYVQDAWIRRLSGGVLVDPDTGFAIGRGRRLIQGSLPYSGVSALPSALRAVWRDKRKALRLPRAISLRDVYETNYYHALHDVLGRLPYLARHVPLDAPLLIGGRLWRTPFFQGMLPRLRDRGLQLVDQGDRHVHADELIVCKPMPLDRERMDGVLDLLGIPTPSVRVPETPGLRHASCGQFHRAFDREHRRAGTGHVPPGL